MAGEEDFSNKEAKEYEFVGKKRWQKILILIMGPLMNIFLAWGILSFINYRGVEVDKYKLEKPVISYVEIDSPAMKSAVKVGDEIIAINGNKIANWGDLELFVGANGGETLELTLIRNGKEIKTLLNVEAYGKHKIGYSGLYWSIEPVIQQLQKNSPALKSGLQVGDKILAVNDKKVKNYFYMRELLKDKGDKIVKFTVLRDNKVLNYNIKLMKYNNRGYLGIWPKFPQALKKQGFFASIVAGTNEMKRLVTLTLSAFKRLFTGRLSPKTLSGPIEIARVSGAALESGYINFLTLMAFISLQLGIVNLFPVPALDGGHLLIYTLEGVFRRDFSPKVKTLLINFGFILLISLMAFVIFNDISKLFN